MTNNWVNEFAELIASESYKLIKNSPKPKGQNKVTNTLISRVLKFYIENAVLDTLYKNHGDKLSNEAQYEAVHADFVDLKSKMQDDIAEAFESAFRKYSNKSMDYCCVISPFPTPLNKEMI